MPKFTWNKWDFDSEGDAYVIRKSLCPKPEDIPDFIVKEDELPEHYKSCIAEIAVEEGWCRFYVSRYWDDYDEPKGGFGVEFGGNKKRKPGWFPVWIVRVGAEF